VKNQSLYITGERVNEVEEDNERYHRRERTFGRFERILPLAEGTDVNNITAEMKNGVLELIIPKPKNTTPPTHRIQIN